MKRLQERIVQKAERNFDRGNNSFLAIGALNSVAIELLHGNRQEANEARIEARERVLRALAQKGGRAEIYALRDDYGSGQTDSMDFVRVTERSGIPTEESYRLRLGTETVIIRASTDSLE